MRKYEVMVILDSELEEKTIVPSLDTFLNVIKADGGSVEKVDFWGKRRFAYEINHKTDGYYAVIELTSTSEAVAELDRQLSLNEADVRTTVICPNWSTPVKASSWQAAISMRLSLGT